MTISAGLVRLKTCPNWSMSKDKEVNIPPLTHKALLIFFVWNKLSKSPTCICASYCESCYNEINSKQRIKSDFVLDS